MPDAGTRPARHPLRASLGACTSARPQLGPMPWVTQPAAVLTVYARDDSNDRADDQPRPPGPDMAACARSPYPRRLA